MYNALFDQSGHLVPRLAVQLASTGFRRAASPLFVEKGDLLLKATITQIAHPIGITEACISTTFAAGDHPGDIL
jgi:hypothetical protein